MLSKFFVLSVLTIFSVDGQSQSKPTSEKKISGARVVRETESDDPFLCVYECVNGTWSLTGALPPPGLVCPEFIGDCPAGSTIKIPAIPEDPSASKILLQPNQGLYKFSPSAGAFIFSAGLMNKGFMFKQVISLEKLVELFPEEAAKILSENADRMTSGFEVILPAVAR